MSTFQEQLLSMQPGPQREEFIKTALYNEGPPKQFAPVEVRVSDTDKLIFYATLDYLMVDGMRVPLSGIGSQEVANHFGLMLPTKKMAEQIYKSASLKTNINPMSAGGEIGGKHYSSKEVIKSKMQDSDTYIAFNNRINQQTKKRGGLIAGHMKDNVAPEFGSNLNLHGLYDSNGKPIQSETATPHPQSYSDYSSGTRLVKRTFKIITKDSTSDVDIDELLSNPKYSKFAEAIMSKKMTSYPQYNQKEAAKPLQEAPQAKTPVQKIKKAPSKNIEAPKESHINDESFISFIEQIRKELEDIKF